MILGLGCFLLAVAFALPALAQGWPGKPIRLVVGFTRGGGVRDRYREAGADVSDMSQAEFDAYVRADLEKWRKVAREANIVVE